MVDTEKHFISEIEKAKHWQDTLPQIPEEHRTKNVCMVALLKFDSAFAREGLVDYISDEILTKDFFKEFITKDRYKTLKKSCLKL